MAEPVIPPTLGLKTQVWRFVVTGGLAAIVDFGIYVALLAAGLHVNVAKTISFIAGTVTAYLINRRWTFQAPPSRARFIAVCVLYALTYAVQVGINYLFYMQFENQPWRADGVRHRPGHRDGDQLHRAAIGDLPAALTPGPLAELPPMPHPLTPASARCLAAAIFIGGSSPPPLPS